jgi:hypothetical protein
VKEPAKPIEIKEEVKIIQQVVKKPNVEDVSVIDDHHSGA